MGSRPHGWTSTGEKADSRRADGRSILGVEGNGARVRSLATSEAMEDVRALKLESLKERVGDSTYVVDPGEVAAAILRRPETRLWLIPGGLSARQERRGETASGEVVEPS
jgi:anti-sigma28 factor (negative regulator of flagellin synthesis)